MRIAIYDLIGYPEGGDSTWLRHFKSGLSDCGVDFTHYRHSLPGWAPTVSRLPKRATEAAQLLDEHDLVLVPDLVADTLEQDRWLTPLELTSTTVVGMLHGLHYGSPKRRTGLEAFSRVVQRLVVTDARFLKVLPQQFSASYVEMPFLPYAPRGQLASTREYTVMASRVAPRKNQYLFAQVADHLVHPPVIYGNASGSWGGVTPSQKLFDRLVSEGWNNAALDRPGKYEPWALSTSAGAVLRYAGGYNDWVTPYQRAAVAVNLTEASNGPGHLEYVTLEAIDAGVASVVPEYQLHEAYDRAAVTGVDTSDQDKIPWLINRAAEAPLEAEKRAELLKLHDPAVYVYEVLSWAL